MRPFLLGLLLAPLFRLVPGHCVDRGQNFWGSYSVYLRSRRWAVRRWFVILRDGRCRDCGARGTDVHHQTYERVGNEHLSDLVLLCGRCHRMKKMEREWKKLIAGW